MVLLAILGKIDNSASQVISAVLLFVFNSFFAIGWLGMTWLYVRGILPILSFIPYFEISDIANIQPAEIVGLRIRAPANALSTASNWAFNFMVVMVTGPSFQNINWGTYIGKFLPGQTFRGIDLPLTSSVCRSQRLHHPNCIPLLPRNSRTLLRR